MKKTKLVWEVYRNKGAMILLIGLIANAVSRYIFDEKTFTGYKPSILLCIGTGIIFLVASVVRRLMPAAEAKIISNKANAIRFIIFMALIAAAAILISR